VESKKNVIFWLAEWIILALLWLVLVPKLEWSEIWIGLATSAWPIWSGVTVSTSRKPQSRLSWPESCPIVAPV
jgi:multisubunit Na+/H+ antiporter MnhE subunit